MRVFAVLAVLAAAISSHQLLGPAPAGAQQNVCQPNPSPVDPADPNIIVSSPTAGASVTSPITVTGQARVFEAQFNLALYDASGNQIATASAQSQEGQVLSPFTATIAFSVTTATPACLWVFDLSAADGSPQDVVQIALTLQPAATPGATPAATATAGPSLPSTGASNGGGGGAIDLWGVAGLTALGAGLAAAGWTARRRPRRSA